MRALLKAYGITDRVVWVAGRLRSRQAFKGVGDPYDAIRNSIRLEQGAHQDGCAAAPRARFDEIPRYFVFQDLFHAGLDIVQPTLADHRVADERPIPALAPDLGVKRSGPDHQHRPSSCTSNKPVEDETEDVRNRPSKRTRFGRRKFHYT